MALTFSTSSCGVENEHLITKIKNKRIITIYTKSGNTIQDKYVFKVKEDRITLNEKHGDHIENRLCKNLERSTDLKNFIVNSADGVDIENSIEYMVKCGIEECRIYPNSENLDDFEELLASFTESPQ